MRITKHFTTIEGYMKSFERKYKLERYRQNEDSQLPVVCFGMYSKQGMHYIMNHQGLLIIIWSGSDGLNLCQPNYQFFVRWCIENKHRVFHLAYSKWLVADLKGVGIEHISKRIFPMEFDRNVFEVVPLGKKIYHYTAGKSRDDFYGKPLAKKIQDEIPAFQMLWGTRNGVPHREVWKLYADCFCGVRFTSHDNMAMSVIEMSLMGRYSIFNGNVPGALPYETKRDVIDYLKVEWMKEEPDKELSDETWEFIYDDRKWLDTKFYE